jgi:hypothetical protein
LEPGKARRRRPRLARNRAPVQLRHPGRLARGRERQRRARPGIRGISAIFGRGAGAARDRETVDDDEHLAAYNAYLARINKPQDG